MKCTVCKNGDCRPGLASVMFDKDGSIVVFRNVKAMVCDTCGAKSFDAETAASLLAQARAAREKGSEVEVINLKAA